MLELDFTAKGYYTIAGWQPLGFLKPCKLREYYENKVINTKHQKYLLAVPDYIISQLTQLPVTDVTNAQMTGFFDI